MVKEYVMKASQASVFKNSESAKSQGDNKGKNTLSELNTYLFASLERLNNLDISDENAEKEIQRSEAITKTASTIISQGQLVLSMQKHMDEYGLGQQIEMPLFGITDNQLLEENMNLRERVKKNQDWQ